jgi:hypothetical protein
MSLKDAVFYAVCTVTWFILLPALLVGAAITFVASACSELRDLWFGRRTPPPDESTAREMARRMCLRL